MNRLLKSALAACLLAASPAAAQAAPLVDCPLRDAPFSTASPLIDILLSAPARAVVDKAVPGLTGHLPPGFMGSKPPSFAAILTLKEATGMLGLPGLDLAALDRELAAIPVTDADRVARCERYDTRAPALVVPAGHPRVLLFEKINGFRDVPSVNAAHAAFAAMAKDKHWALVTTENGAAFTPALLRKFDVVIWNNISGDVLTLGQRAAFKAWMEHGGGYVGVHGSAGDPVYFWDWYVDGLLGARFAGHPFPKQFQTARVHLDDAAHPVAAGLPAQWEMSEEWYSFKNNPRAAGAHVIATLDESTYEPRFDRGAATQNLAMGDHPIAWTRCIGTRGRRGHMFYSAIGHRPERYADAVYVQMLEQAVAWAASPDDSACKAASKP